MATRIASLLALSAVNLTWGQAPAEQKEAPPAPAQWTVLFRSDDPSLWDQDVKAPTGEQIAIPIKLAQYNLQYLRLRRMDTGEDLILPLTRYHLKNGKPPTAETGFWWNGSAKEEWKGRHLGIVQGPRHKFPAPKGMIAVMNDGWDGFAGSGFGHKCFVNDAQYYCWRGKEIPRTVFEIAVSPGPLSPDEQRSIVRR